MPLTLFGGARGEQGRRGVVDADESQHKPRCVVGGQLLVAQHRPTPRVRSPPPHSWGQCGTAYPALCSSANQDFWKRTNSSSPTPVCD